MHEYTTIAAIQARMLPEAVPAFLDENLLLEQELLRTFRAECSIISCSTYKAQGSPSYALTSGCAHLNGLHVPCRRRSKTQLAHLKSTWTHA